LPIEQTRQARVIYYAQKQAAHRTDENATYPAPFDNADTDDDANRGKCNEDTATEATTTKDRSNPRREGEHNAAQFLAETARGPEGTIPDYRELASRVDFQIEIAKVRQSFHRQAVFVLFARDVLFHQMLGKPFSGSLRLGTVRKSAVYAQRAING
jgi:hypothetical protein